MPNFSVQSSPHGHVFGARATIKCYASGVGGSGGFIQRVLDVPCYNTTEAESLMGGAVRAYVTCTWSDTTILQRKVQWASWNEYWVSQGQTLELAAIIDINSDNGNTCQFQAHIGSSGGFQMDGIYYRDMGGGNRTLVAVEPVSGLDTNGEGPEYSLGSCADIQFDRTFNTSDASSAVPGATATFAFVRGSGW
jgi:hypothetical protein